MLSAGPPTPLPEPAPVAICVGQADLSGFWMDELRLNDHMVVAQGGGRLNATFVGPGLTCGPEHAPCLAGEVTSCGVTGLLSVCGTAGTRMDASFSAELFSDGCLRGGWTDPDGGDQVPVRLLRARCAPVSASVFGLDAANERIACFEDDVVYRIDGSYMAVPAGSLLDPNTDLELRRADGIDLTSRDAAGYEGQQVFTAGTHGTVEAVAEPWNTIHVLTPAGDRITYMGAARVDISAGQWVEPTTALGLTGNASPIPGLPIHLHVQATGASGAPLPVDCALQ